MACFRLVTVPPLPPLPDFSVPCFLRRIALSTVLLAALPYFRPLDFLVERFVAAIYLSPDDFSREKHPQGLSLTFFPQHRSQCSIKTELL